MKAFLIVIGLLLVFVAGTIIFQDVYNELQWQAHPIKTTLTFCSNLIGEGEHEDYLYPYSNRELKVLALALGGIFILIAGFSFSGGQKKSSDGKKNKKS